MSELPPNDASEESFDSDNMSPIDFLMIMDSVMRDAAERAVNFKEQGEALQAEFFGRVAIDIKGMIPRWTSIIENPARFLAAHRGPVNEEPPTSSENKI